MALDLLRAENQTGKRQVIIVARERDGRTVTTICKSEAEGVAFARANIAKGTTVHADEASHWDKLTAAFPIKRVNHKIEYKAEDGACSNQAESFFSRVRRSEIGIHHDIPSGYLNAYAAELAWREDNRRVANGTQFTMVASSAAIAPKSLQWCGYWQKS